MTNNLTFHKLNLQLFAEGGAGDTGASGSTSVTGMNAASQQGVKSDTLANVVYGKQTSAQTTDVQTNVESQQVDRNAEFEKLIKGEYKDLFDARMQDTIQKRLKGTKETVDKYNALSPTIDMLARKYGVDANNIEALNKAIEEDDSYYEEEALEKGVSVEQLKEIKKLEKENAALKKAQQEKDRREFQEKQVAQWMDQAKNAKQMYPNLDFKAEFQNDAFRRLLSAGVDVGTAYQVIHKDEIMPAAMQYTAKAVEQKITNKIIANGARPVENGISSQSATVTKSDVSQLSNADIEEVMRRVANGERISFA